MAINTKDQLGVSRKKKVFCFSVPWSSPSYSLILFPMATKRIVVALVSAGILASLVCVVVMDGSVVAPGSHVEYKVNFYLLLHACTLVLHLTGTGT